MMDMSVDFISARDCSAAPPLTHHTSPVSLEGGQRGTWRTASNGPKHSHHRSRQPRNRFIACKQSNADPADGSAFVSFRGADGLQSLPRYLCINLNSERERNNASILKLAQRRRAAQPGRRLKLDLERCVPILDTCNRMLQ